MEFTSTLYYPTKRIEKAENFQSFTINENFSITRTKFQIHKAFRLGRIFETEKTKLLSENIFANYSERVKIQRFLYNRPDNYTKQIKPYLLDLLKRHEPIFLESFKLVSAFCFVLGLATLAHYFKG